MPIGLTLERSGRGNASHPLMPFPTFNAVEGALATRTVSDLPNKLGKHS